MKARGRIQHYLRQQAADYQPLLDWDEKGAQRVAAAVRVPGRRVAKAVVVRDAGGAPTMVLLPATERLDLRALSWALGNSTLALATEKDLGALFPDCDRGVVPPYGALYGLRVYVDPCLSGMREIVLPAGDGRGAVAMAWPEFQRLARPIVGQLCFHRLPGRAA